MQTEIVKEPEPILRAKALEVTVFDAALNSIVSDMFKIMRDKNGVGLAAPQVGLSMQIFVYGFEHSVRYPGRAPVPLEVMINPKISSQSDELVTDQEGCLSVPFKRGAVARSKSVTIKYQDVDGNFLEKTLHDFAARIVQHEIDHLNGVLYVDKAIHLHDSRLI